MRRDSLDELTCSGELHRRNLTAVQRDLQARFHREGGTRRLRLT
jgi:hypothetical protein